MTLVRLPAGYEAVLVLDLYDWFFVVQLLDEDYRVHQHEEEAEVAG